MRYIILPWLVGLREGSYLLLVPLCALICIAQLSSYAPTAGRTNELVLAAMILIAMLSFELWRALKTIQEQRELLMKKNVTGNTHIS